MIYDPTREQFPTAGGCDTYEEYDPEHIECCNCGENTTESTMVDLGNGRYFACSQRCAHQFVGIE